MSATPTKRPYKSRRTMPQRNTNFTSLNVEQQPCSSRSDAGALSVTATADIYSPVCTSPILSTQRPRRYKRQDALTPAATIGEKIPRAAHRLKPASYCTYCGAKKFESEPPAFCCGNGSVKVATNSCPPELLRLYTSTDEDAIHFQTYSRLYNNLFSFSSLGGHIDCKTHRGIYVFRLLGQLYHFLPNLIPENNQPKYMQLYFYDTQFEQRNRCSFFQELRHDIVDALMKIMDENPYAKFFKTLRETPIDEHTTIHINKDAVLDQRVYNAPTSDEVAAIWSDWSAEEDHTGPYIVVTGQSNKVHRIKHYYGCYDPLQYPLLFPFGDNGWHPGIQKISLNMPNMSSPVQSAPVHNVSNADALIDAEDAAASATIKKGISCREYYAYILQIRVGTWILKAVRLLLQFVVDMYVKLENSRLDFFRNNQPTIRADLYQGIIDTLTAGENQGANAGRRIVLPPSFIGGPRDMRRRYLNAMALVQRFGKPDIFATMTCNPNWPEIKAELAVVEKPQNRPDLIARIFHSKLRLARKEIMDKKIFGEVAALIYVVEFQKRGLPHAHFLIILKPSHKIKSPEDFDKFVSAEIPSTENAYLRATVLSHMMHGLCGIANPNCPCMKYADGKRTCKSRYPKAFTEYTTSQDDGYPTYKRRNTGETIRVRQYHMDNRWVIPYNHYHLAMFDCHFNVEVCSTIQAVKYLYKYVYKGHDRISFNIGQDNCNAPDFGLVS